jgi:anti-sigma B factor antagonist
VLTCSGRIVQGAESERLRQHVTDALKDGPFVVLDFSGVDYMDSSGLALLVRLRERARAASGNIKLSGTSEKIAQVLRVTRLENILESYESPAAAIAAFSRSPAAADASIGPPPDVLCVDSSTDMLAYLRALLRQAGYAAVTADNVSDALKLLRTTHPKLVAVGSVGRDEADDRAAESFYTLARARGLIELPPDFSTHDAGEIERQFIEQVKSRLTDATDRR